MIRNASRALLACLSLVTPALAGAADEALAKVDAYLGTLKTLSADFDQVVRDDKGQITNHATGKLTLSRPDRFRWDYREPYVQTIVGDGRKLWLYDADLQQVTVRALEQGLGSTPAMLLSGSGKAADAFVGAGILQRGNLSWCTLKPRTHGSDFDRVSLAFDARGNLVAMELVDKLGQATEIGFRNLVRNGKVDEQAFRFVPPKGADVIGNAGS